MTKEKFVFDGENLNYRQVNKSLQYRLMKGLIWVGSSLLLGLAIVVVYSLLFDTPRERELRQENKSLDQDLEILNERYERIDTVLKELSYIDDNIYRTIFETEPVGNYDSLRIDHQKVLKLLGQENEVIVDLTVAKIKRLSDEIQKNAVSYSHLKNHLSVIEEFTGNIPAIQPIQNLDLTQLASGFGNRMHPYYKIVKFHFGMDFTAPIGTEVYATADGIVEDLTRTGRGSGNTVVINHGNGYKTYYSHLHKFNVRNNAKVKRWDVIGWVGNTGLSVGPHLHYEVHLNGEAVNPVNYFFLELSPKDYDRMIEMSIKSGQSFD